MPQQPAIGDDVTELMNGTAPASTESPWAENRKRAAEKAASPEIDAHGNRIVRNADGSIKFMQGPGFSGNADTSPDRNILDAGGIAIAPEDALAGGQIVRKVLKPGLTLAGRAAAAAGETLPIVKYELTHKALGAMNLPEPWATMAAIGLSVYKGKGKTPAGPVAAETVERAATAPRPAPTAPAAPPPILADDGRPWGTPKPTLSLEQLRAKIATMPPAAESRTPPVPRSAPAAPAPPPAAQVAPAVESAPAAAAPVRAAPFNPNTALKTARDAFAARGTPPQPGEVSNVVELLRRGKSPDEALAVVLKNRPAAPVDPATAFNARFGTLSDAEVQAALDARNAAGKIKTPSAATARARRQP